MRFKVFSPLKTEKYFDIDASPHICFSKPNSSDIKCLNEYLNSTHEQKMIYLLNPSYNFNVFQYSQRLYTIITTNGSYSFNIDFLRDSSTKIDDALKTNPKNFEYHLNIKDEENVLEKIEKLFLGHPIEISEKEAYSFKLVINELKITGFKKRTLSQFDSLPSLCSTYQLSIPNFYSYLRETIPKPFQIVTKNKKYNCNTIGIYSSNVIREFLLKNPNLKIFNYDIEDEFNEFQPICDFLNFNFVQITTDNMHSLKMIAEDLQINMILNDIKNFIDDYENRIQTIDDQQSIIDSIDELFEMIFKIKELTVKSVKEKIIESPWSKTEENVQELAAFIIQAVKTNFLLHPYLADLIEILNKESNETNKLEILVPFIVNKLMLTFGTNKQICLFIFKLHKKGFIEKVEILTELKKLVQIEKMHNCIIFAPELFEIADFDITRFMNYFQSPTRNFLKFYFPNNIEKFNNMRETGEPDDLITKSLRNDDVDTLQSIISKNQVDLSLAIIPYNIFDTFPQNNQPSYINYAALCGSLKCFKYLLLNHANLDDSSFAFAVAGGNVEILKIIDQQSIDSNNNNKRKMTSKLRGNQMKYQTISCFDKISPAIKNHQNDLFDWICEQKFSNVLQNKELISKILFTASENGDLHSIASIVDKGFDFFSIEKELCHKYIQNASKNGFYKLLEFLSIIMKKKIDEKTDFYFDSESSVHFGNISIFKFYCKIVNNLNINDALYYSVEKECTSIAKYIIDNYLDKRIKLSQSYVYKLLSNSINLKSSYIFNYLIDKFQSVDTKLLDSEDKIKLLSESCHSNKVEIGKKITDLILEQNTNEKLIDFTLPFFNAADSGSTKLCQYLIDKKVFIDFDLLSFQVQNLAFIKKDVLDIIIKNMTKIAKDTFISCYLKNAICAKNKTLIEYLLNEKAICDDALFCAVKTNDVEIVNMVLNKNREPSFVNQTSENGTALNIAVLLDNLEIVKRLLSIPGIDLSLYERNNNTPLITAISELKIDIMNAIIDFYGPNIQSQNWQLDEAVKKFLVNISTKKNEKEKFLVVLNRLLEIESVDLNLHTDKYTLFSYACEINEIDIVKTLMNLNKVDINSYAQTNGNSPLMIAIENENIEIAKLLIECNRTSINQRNYENETALTLAVKKEQGEIVDMIISNDKFNPIESRLDYAFYCSTESISSYLITAKNLDVNYKHIESNTFKQNKGNTKNKMIDLSNLSASSLFSTTLMNAVKNIKNSKIDQIINHPSFNPEKSYVKEAIFITCQNQRNNNDIFNKLIKYVDNDVNIANNQGLSLLEVAIKNNNENMVTAILNNENFDSNRSHILNAFILSYSIEEPLYDVMNQLVKFDKSHEHLIDFNQFLPDGNSFFTLITRNDGQIYQLVSFLIENGADPNLPDKNGIYPLEYAIYLNSSNYVNALISSGKIDYSIRLKSKKPINRNQSMKMDDETFLHIATRSDNDRILSAFLRNKLIDINATDSYGETPLMKACRVRNIEAINLLFNEDDLDYLHCNNEGDDALKIVQKMFNINKKLNPVKTKSKYLELLKASLFRSRYNNTNNENKNRMIEMNESTKENEDNKNDFAKKGFSFDSKKLDHEYEKSQKFDFHKHEQKNETNPNLLTPILDRTNDSSSILSTPKINKRNETESPLSLTPKIEAKDEISPFTMTASSDNQLNQEPQMQDEIMTAIQESFGNVTPEILQKISAKLSFIAEKRARIIAKSLDQPNTSKDFDK